MKTAFFSIRFFKIALFIFPAFLITGCQSAVDQSNYQPELKDKSKVIQNSNAQKEANKTVSENTNAAENTFDEAKTANLNTVAADTSNLITNTGLGKIRLGAKVADIKKSYPDAAFKIVSGTLDDGVSDIEASRGGEKLFYFTTENFDETETVELPAQNEKIDFLLTDNPKFATAQGVKVGQTFGDAEKLYGKPKFFGELNYDFVVFDNPAVNKIAFYFVHAGEKQVDRDYSPKMRITHIGIGK